MSNVKPDVMFTDLTDQEKRDLRVALGLNPEPPPRPIIEVGEGAVQFKSAEEISKALMQMALAGAPHR